MRIWSWFGIARARREAEAATDAELEFHLEMRVADLVRSGSTPEAARAQAIAELGDPAAVRAELSMLEASLQDRRRRRQLFGTLGFEARRAGRVLRRDPGFAITAVLTLSLGLGSAGAIFTLLDNIVLRPLPYDDPESLVRLDSPVPGVGADSRWDLARAEFLYFRESNRSFEELGLYRFTSVTAAGAQEGGERLHAAQVEPGVARVLGIGAARGRLIEAADNLSPVHEVVVLGYGYFQRRFGGDASVIGSTIRIDGQPHQIVGVLPRHATLPEEEASPSFDVDLWLPLWLDPAQPPANHHMFRAVGRLAEGAALEEAQRELTGLTQRLPEVLSAAYTPEFMRTSGFRTAITPLRADVVGGISRALWLLFAAVGLVLVIAAANVANLFLVRFEARRRDLAVRTALGASRAHVACNLLAESMLIASSAGILAIGFSYVALRILLSLAPSTLPRLEVAQLGAASFLFVGASATVLGVLLGMAPLIRHSVDLGGLREEGRNLTASRGGNRARAILVVGQTALALVLLTAAGLLLRSFQQLRRVDPGLDAKGVITFSVHIPSARYEDYVATGAFYRSLAERIGALPGVLTVGMTSSLPFNEDVGCTVVHQPPDAARAEPGPCVPVILFSPGYFEALGIPVRGSTLDWRELEAGRGDAVVSEALARRLWPGENALEHSIRANHPGPPFYTVSGVAGDVRANGQDRPAIEAVYFPIVRTSGGRVFDPQYSLNVVVRTSGASLALVPAMRAALASIDADAALDGAREMQDFVDSSAARVSFTMSLLLVAAFMALLLSAVGLYGSVAYVVRQRTVEIGLRMALGAGTGQVRSMIVRQSLRLALLGAAIGVAAALALTRFLRTLLFEISPADPVVLAASITMLVGVAAIASFLPARRASRIDPLRALHQN